MLSKSQIGLIRSLQDKKVRLEKELFLVEGEKMVTELFLSNFTIKQVYINKGISPNKKIFNSRLHKNIEWIELNEEEMQKISGHPAPSQYLALVHIPRVTPENLEWPVLVLDDVQDPGNLGTILRIADWFGFKALICSKGTVSWHNPKVIQSSMGSFLRVPVLEIDLPEFFERVSGTGKKIYGADLNGDSLYNANLESLEILVLGNESKGISLEIKTWIQNFIYIPGKGGAESLNVAIAAGVICSERNRQLNH